MLEAQVAQGSLWKKLMDCINGLVNEANFDCSPGGLSIQAMDQSHVALVHMLLRDDGFVKYQCERNSILGLNLATLCKVLKVIDGADALTLRHDVGSDTINLLSENAERSRRCEYTLKLMEIEAEAMGIPEMEYACTVQMASADFAKIIRDMATFGDTVTISVEADGVKFSSAGDTAEGYAFLRSAGGAAAAAAAEATRAAARSAGAVKAEAKTEPKVKPEKTAGDDDDDVPIGVKYAAVVKPETTGTTKRGGAAAAAASAEAKDATSAVFVALDEPLQLSFALRFMSIFSKGSALSDRVTLRFAKESPCMVEFAMEGIGWVRFYLAPKVDDAE